MTSLHTRVRADGTIVEVTATGSQVTITDAGKVVGAAPDLEAAFDAHSALVSCAPDDEFNTPDEGRLRALLRLDIAIEQLERASFGIAINGDSTDIDVETDLGLEGQHLASVSDGGIRGCSASVLGRYLWQDTPDMEDASWLRAGVADDLHAETLDWLESCPFQGKRVGFGGHHHREPPTDRR